jgi:tetratricopeptide (TPR) repeat protein
MKNMASAFLGALVLVLTFAPGSPAQTESWAGKRIMMKREGVKFGHTDAQGRQVYLGTLKFLDYIVLAEQNGWLKIRQEGKEGWIDKDEALTIDGAIKYYTAKINQDPRDAHAYGQRAAAWEFKDELDIAIKDYSKAIELDPSYSWAWENRGEARFKKEQYDKAVSDFSESIRLNPEGYWSYSYRGLAHIRLKNYDKGISDLDEAIRLDPRYATNYFRRAQGWQGKRNYAKARSDLAEAIRLDDKYADALNLQAWLLATCPEAGIRDGAKAVKSATRACELTDWKDANNIDTLAAAYAETGDFARAVKHETQVLELAGKNAPAEYTQRLELYKNQKPYREE